MRISTKTFRSAKSGARFVGQNKIAWIVIKPHLKGVVICKSPHTDELENIHMRNGRIIDSDGYEIEELAGEVIYIPA